MICFIAPNPDSELKKDGYLQRVSSIDRLFDDGEKKYLCDASDAQEKMDLITSASMIYVQSIYKSKDVLPLYAAYKDKIVTDLHGVVPEELEYLGYNDAAKEMQRIESEVFKYGKYFVAVTKAMVDHYMAKYHLDDSVKWIVLPIFDANKAEPRTDKLPDKLRVIYAGGLQRWQNPALMEQAVSVAKNYDYIFYTHESRELSDRLSKIQGVSVSIRSGSKDDVFKAYRQADLGLLLRDDHILNRVSCPTKLIEYIDSGVVPVVLSSEIGDFRRLGYSYITYDSFIRGDVDKANVLEFRENNYRVAKELREISDSGINGLRRYSTKFSNEFKPCDTITKNLTSEVLNNSDLTQKIAELNIHIADQQKAISDQQCIIAHQHKVMSEQRQAIDNMYNSKRWQFGELRHHPSNILKLFRKL